MRYLIIAKKNERIITMPDLSFKSMIYNKGQLMQDGYNVEVKINVGMSLPHNKNKQKEHLN